ncbi:MAG: hypothetical protein QXJ64_04215 [Thermosphaera sp.]
MKILEVRPLEPLSLSLSPIGGLDIFTVMQPTPIPLPTTIIGALGAIMNVKLSSNDPMNSLIELINVLKNNCEAGEDPIVLGPLTCFEGQVIDPNRCYAYVYPDRLLSLSKHAIDVRSKIVYLKEECKGSEECYIDFTPMTLTGVSLLRTRPGEDKTVRYGFMYRYPLITFRTSSGRVVNPVYIYGFNCYNDLNAIARLGGEGRIVKLVTKIDETDFLKNITTPLKRLEKGLYLSLSPIPMIPLRDDAIYLTPETVKLPIPVDSIVGIPQEYSPPKIRIIRLGLGFSEVAKKRRPEILGLPPGTVIMIKDNVTTPKSDDNDLMKKLLSIGFATLYKLSDGIAD